MMNKIYFCAPVERLIRGVIHKASIFQTEFYVQRNVREMVRRNFIRPHHARYRDKSDLRFSIPNA